MDGLIFVYNYNWGSPQMNYQWSTRDINLKRLVYLVKYAHAVKGYGFVNKVFFTTTNKENSLSSIYPVAQHTGLSYLLRAAAFRQYIFKHLNVHIGVKVYKTICEHFLNDHMAFYFFMTKSRRLMIIQWIMPITFEENLHSYLMSELQPDRVSLF